MATIAMNIAQDTEIDRSSALKVKQSELILFATQLSVMLDSGVVLSDALTAISEQAKPGDFKVILDDICDKIRNGSSFSAALEPYPKAFNPMFVSLVRASEAAGKMSDMLGVLSRYLDAEAQTRKQVKGAMIYPFIMMMMAISATGTLMFFVLPRFTKIYESRGAALPKLTQWLVSFSQLIGDPQKLTILITSLICVGTAFYFWYQSVSGRRAIDYLKVRTPVVGTMFTDTVLTRSMRIIATMINTGVSLLDAIKITRDSCENYYFQQIWESVDEKIRGGYQFSEALLLAPHSDLIASGVIQMLKAGEKGGRLGQVCDKMSIFYEKKLEATIKNVTSLIEPVMIILMGGIIGTIAIALLLPVFRISSVMAH
jgi:type IV pilus assembly protein PilC